MPRPDSTGRRPDPHVPLLSVRPFRRRRRRQNGDWVNTQRSTYCLVVLAADRTWATEVGRACLTAAAGFTDSSPPLTVTNRLPPPPKDSTQREPSTLVLFLADSTSRMDRVLGRQVGQALARLVPVLAVVRPGADVPAVLPPPLDRRNAVAWEDDGQQAVLDALRILGLAERHRRLFISYRRLETTGIALQLRPDRGFVRDVAQTLADGSHSSGG